jgi:hypothetical protein
VHGAVAVAALHPLVGAQPRLEGCIPSILPQQLSGGVPDLTIEHGSISSSPKCAADRVMLAL